MPQHVRLKLYFLQPLKHIFLTLILLSFSAPVMALCVLMQDFHPDAAEFAGYVKQDMYYPKLTYAYRMEDGTSIPTPTKMSVAGESCYIFSSYSDLSYYLEHNKDLAGRSFMFPPEGEDATFTLPEVTPDEPIMIHQIAHGSRTGLAYLANYQTGYYENEDVLKFVKQWGGQHPIAMTNNSCYSSDLLAKMLLDQKADPNQGYIDKFCLMTTSPFSHVQVAAYLEDAGMDSSTAPFVAKMRNARPGTSFAQYFQENNYYIDYKDHRRPLAICSAANWQEMGLVDYLAYGEDVFNFYEPYLLREGNNPPSILKALYPDGFSSEALAEERIKLAANLINHVNELLNISYCSQKGDPQNYVAHEFLYFAANKYCSDLQDINAAEYCSPRYHLAHTVHLLDDGNYNESIDWKRDCQANENLAQALAAWKSASTASEKEQKIQEFIKTAAELQATCAELACAEISDKGKDRCLYIAADRAAWPIGFAQQKEKILAQIRQAQKEFEYAPMLSSLLKQQLNLAWSPQEIEQKLNAYYEAHGLKPEEQKIDCGEVYLVAFDIYPSPQDRFELVNQCSTLYQDLGKTPLSSWPKLPTDYPKGSKYADYLAQILVGAIDINELNGLAINGVPASSADRKDEGKILPELEQYISPSRDMILQFHNVMDVAMAQAPKDEYSLDVRRRKACENFKLGGIAAQK
ncbi:MAG: hypothetical protein J6Y94_06260 [Bacteriovoracaceae bacterium]|nr:hypothetical protein [Bacteriovoracaceae bacterium]